jgi:hypothetical protein
VAKVRRTCQIAVQQLFLGKNIELESVNNNSYGLDTVLVEESLDENLEEQFRSEFSEGEYSEGNAAQEYNVELPMEMDDVYNKVRMVVQKTRLSLSQKKNILQ